MSDIQVFQNEEKFSNDFLFEADYLRNLDSVLFYQDKRFESTLFIQKAYLLKILGSVQRKNRYEIINYLVKDG